MKRQVIGNEIVHRTVNLCRLLHEHGSFLTLENPLSSYAWKAPAVIDLALQCSCTTAHLDQCRFGLRIPGEQGGMGLAVKPTKIMGTLPYINQLNCRCNKDHSHIAVIGGVRHKWRKRSQLAGSYPIRLCSAIAKAFERSFA